MSKKKRNISLETTRFQGLTTLKFRERRRQRARETEGEWKGVFFLLFPTVCRNGEIKLETVLGRTGNNGTRSTSPSRSNSRNIKLLPFISVEFYPVRHQIAREKKEAVQFLAFGRQFSTESLKGVVSGALRGLKTVVLDSIKWKNGAILRVIRHGC